VKLTRKQLSLLIENYLKDATLLTEIKKKSFNQFIQRGIIDEQDFKMYVFGSDWVPPFNDPIMAKILFNTLNDGGQGHSLRDISRGGEEILNKIVANARRGDLPPRPVRGSAVEFIDILPKIDVIQPDNTTLTYNEAMEYIESGAGIGKRTEVLNQVIADGVNGQTSEFEVIAMPSSSNPYFVAYPKTYKGSISLGRMGPNYKYLNPNSPDEKAQLGNMTWCTTIDGSGNMFLNYHQKMNLHMYYLTRVGDYNPRSIERKFCLSFAKQGDHVQLHEDGHATVNGDNKPASKETIIRHIGQRLYDLIEADVKKPSRKTIDIVAYYKSLTLDQYRDLRAAVTSEQDLNLFSEQVRGICQYSNNVDIFIEMVKDPARQVYKHAIAYRNSARPEVAAVAIEYVPFDDLIKSILPLPPDFMTKVYRSEKSKNRGMIPSNVLHNFIDTTHNLDPNNYHGVQIYKREPTPEIFDEMVRDIVTDSVIYGNAWNDINPPREYYFGRIVRHPDLTPEHFQLLYQFFGKQRDVDNAGRHVLVLVGHPNCPEEIKLKEFQGRFNYQLRDIPGFGNVVANEFGEIQGNHDKMISTFAVYTDNKTFKTIEEKLPDTFLKYLDAAAENGSFTYLNSKIHLDPVYVIKVFERAIHREILLNPNNYRNGMLDFRTRPSVNSRAVILKLREDPLIKGPDRQKYTEQTKRTKRFAEEISLFVEPNRVVELQEVFQDQWMEALMPASEMGMDNTKIVKLYEKGYRTINNIHDYMAEIIAYLQEHESQPEMNNPETYGWALALYKIVKYVIDGKSRWQSYSQANALPWPPNFNDMLI
jgi:hypothetical protein